MRAGVRAGRAWPREVSVLVWRTRVARRCVLSRRSTCLRRRNACAGFSLVVVPRGHGARHQYVLVCDVHISGTDVCARAEVHVTSCDVPQLGGRCNLQCRHMHITLTRACRAPHTSGPPPSPPRPHAIMCCPPHVSGARALASHVPQWRRAMVHRAALWHKRVAGATVARHPTVL